MAKIPRLQIAIYAFYLLVAAIITYPVVTSLSTQFIGGSTSDAYEMARHIWWFKYAIQTGQDVFYQSNLGYPDGFSGVTLWANPLQFFPAWLFAFFMPIAAAYNTTILLTMALNGWSMYWLAKDRLNQHVPALIAGLVFMAYPTFQGHLFDGHAGLIIMWAAPLLIYSLFHLRKTPSARWFWLSVLFFILSPLGHMVQIFFVLLPVMALFLLAYLWQRDGQAVRQIIWVGVIGSFIQLVFLIPAIQGTLSTSAYTEAGGHVRYSADLLAIVSPSFMHPFWGNLLDYPRSVLGTNLVEGSNYVGIIAGVLMIIALLRRKDARWWGLLAVVTWFLSLGPLLKFLDQPVKLFIDDFESNILLIPWALMQDVPGFGVIRAPGRFSFALALAVAMLAGYGLSVIWGNGKTSALRYGIAGILVIGIVWEYQFFWTDNIIDMPTMPATQYDVFDDIRDDDDVRAIFNIPWNHLLAAKDALYFQTIHEKPLIAGQVSRQTPVDPAKLALLQQSLNPVQLDEAGADIVVLHIARAADTDEDQILLAHAQRELGDPIYIDDQIAVFEVPDDDVEAGFTAAPPTETVITDDSHIYLYAPEPAWVQIEAEVNADGRELVISLDGQPLNTLLINGETDFTFPVPVPVSGYHTVSLDIDPPCPANISQALSCRVLTLTDVFITPITEGAIYEPVQLERGVELAAFYIEPIEDQQLSINLWWRFEQSISDQEVRFVHILDRNDRLVAQNDIPLGPLGTDDMRSERISFDLSNLPSGEYHVASGWYTFTGTVRYNILVNGIETSDDSIEIGNFRITD